MLKVVVVVVVVMIDGDGERKVAGIYWIKCVLAMEW